MSNGNAGHTHTPINYHPHFKHDPNIQEQVARRLKQTLEPISQESSVNEKEGDGKAVSIHERSKVLDPVEFRDFKLTGKLHLSHNTALYRFSLPNKTDSLGLPPGQHVSIMAVINGRKVMRSYTPTSLDTELGHFDLVIKTYPGGALSTYIDRLNIGQSIQARGPKGLFEYSSNLSPHLLMIAGGSGITPMYRIVKTSVLDPNDKTEMRLIYANVDEDDILLRNELEYLELKSKGRFKVFYTLNNPPEKWTGGVGFVDRKMILPHLPAGSPKENLSKVLLCGPAPMMKAMTGILTVMGYEPPHTPADSRMEDEVFLF